MQKEERIAICSLCVNRKLNPQKGLLCGLTNDYANFEGSCDEYSGDQYAITKKTNIRYPSKEKNGYVAGLKDIFFFIVFIVAIARLIARFVN